MKRQPHATGAEGSSVIPLLNWFYDLFFTSKVPAHGQIKELLNIVALVNALLLGAILALASSVNRDELLAADNVWFNNSTSPASKWYKSTTSTSNIIPPSSSLHENTSIGLSLFFAGLIGVVWVYSDMLAKTGQTKNFSYWLKFFEVRDGLIRDEKLKLNTLFESVFRTDPLIIFESRFDEVGDAMWDTPDRRAATVPLFDEQRDERWKRKLAIEHCLFRAPNGFAPRAEIEADVKVYSQMSVDTLGKLLVSVQNEEARVYEREVMMKDRRRQLEGNMRGHAFFLWWGFAKYSVLLLIGVTTFGCIFSILTMRDLFIIKYPDPWIEKYGVSDEKHGLQNTASPTSYGNAWFQVVFTVCAVVIVVSTGLGTAQKVRMITFCYPSRANFLTPWQPPLVPPREQVSH